MTIARSLVRLKLRPGKSSAEFRVPIASLREIVEDGVTQEATVILEAGPGYNVVNPATATIKLKDFESRIRSCMEN